MQNSKTYKLYKSGKLWVVGAVAVAGVAVSANTTQVSADTVPTTTDASTAQSVQATTKAVVLSATTDVVSDASSTVDDGTTIDNGGSSNNDGTTVDNGGSSSSSDNGGSSSSSDNGGSSSSSDNGSSSSSSDNNGSSSNGGGTDSSTTGGNGSSSDNNTVPLTPTTPDTNNQGEVNHVKPVEVKPDNSGNVVDVPTQVASVPSVARAVEAYNQALTANDKDATKAPVVEAKQKLDDAVAKALPLTHATEKSSMGGNGILALAMSGLVALGGLIYKRKHL